MKPTKLLFALVLLAIAVLAATAQQNIPTQTVGNSTPTNNLTVYSAPLKLFTVMGYNAHTNQTFYVNLFSRTNAATNGGTPVFSIPVPATNYYSLDFSYYGANLDACKVCISSNLTTLALTPSNWVSIQAVFKAPQ